MARSTFFWRLKWLFVLLLMAIIDIGPFPFTALLCMSIIVLRPRWFKQFLQRLYPPE